MTEINQFDGLVVFKMLFSVVHGIYPQENTIKQKAWGEINKKPYFKNYFRNIFAITKFFGLQSFGYNTNSLILSYFYKLFICTIIIATAIYSFIYLPINQKYQQNTSRLVLDRFILSLASTCAIYAIFKSMRHEKSFIYVKEQIEQIDRRLRYYGLEIDYNTKWFYFSIIFRGMVLTGLFFVFAFDLDRESYFIFITNKVAKITSASIIYAMQYQYNSLIYLIAKRFRTLEVSVRTNRRKSELKFLIKIYDELISLSHIVNDIYGNQLLIMVALIFLMVTSCANYVVINMILLVVNKSGMVNIILYNVFIGGSKMGELCFIISSCEEAVDAAKEFTEQIYHLMIEDESLRITNDKKLSLHVSSQKDPTFNAAGFFNLDNSLIHAIVAAATTYLVILVQFSLDEED